jgi:hypothetical protein
VIIESNRRGVFPGLDGNGGRIASGREGLTIRFLYEPA